MRIILLLIVIGLLIVGWLGGQKPYALIGAFLFILTYSFELVAIYHDSKLYSKGIDKEGDEKEKKKISKILEKWLSGLIVISGLIAFCIGKDNQNNIFLTGGIIWIGTIVIWFISGIIVKEVTGIPLRMGYGGWYIHRPRKKQRRGFTRGRKNIDT